MQNDEKILLVVGAVALVALVIFNQGGLTRPGAVTATADDFADVPSYLGAAQMSPFAFSPAVGNVLPYASQGTVGQDSNPTAAVNAANYATGSCGCGMA